MMAVWEQHGPPPFVSLAAMIGFKSTPTPGKNKSTDNENFGTMEDLARQLGVNVSSGKAYF